MAGLVTVLLLGIGAQWLAWRIRLPSILLLLLFGFLAGSVTGVLEPDNLLGPLLFPVVSISVALILFEGGLSLRLHEVRQVGRVVRNLVTLGALITWAGCVLSARWVLGLDWKTAWLLGAVLIVSGPTVVLPLLRYVRPIGHTGPLLKWEAILIDPVGAMLAVLVYEAIAVAGEHGLTAVVAGVVLKTLFVGGAIGLVGAVVAVILLQRFWVPDYLETAVVFAIVVAAFAASNYVQDESGLLAVTVLGVALANQSRVRIGKVVEFKENLRVLLIACLFIVLAARVSPDDLTQVGLKGVLFVAVLVLLVRPVSVFLCTIRSGLSWQERAFLAWVAPRGIVAAAVASIFTLHLEERGLPAADLVPATFLTIVGTVAVYGLTAGPVARRLGLAHPDPQGVLLIGAHPLAREIGAMLQHEGYRVLLVDTNWEHVAAARMAGLRATYLNILSEQALYELELGGIGRLLAVTPNHEVNSLANVHFSDIFERSEQYQLAAGSTDDTPRKKVAHALLGRTLFRSDATYYSLAGRLAAGATIKKTTLTEAFDYNAFRDRYGESAVPLFVIPSAGKLTVVTARDAPEPQPGQTLISLVDSNGTQDDDV